MLHRGHHGCHALLGHGHRRPSQQQLQVRHRGAPPRLGGPRGPQLQARQGLGWPRPLAAGPDPLGLSRQRRVRGTTIVRLVPVGHEEPVCGLGHVRGAAGDGQGGLSRWRFHSCAGDSVGKLRTIAPQD